MHADSTATALMPLTGYEPREAGDGHALVAVADGQLTLDELLADIPAPRSAPVSRPELDRRRMHHLLNALLEVHEGRRAVAQLATRLTPELRARLRARSRAAGPRFTLARIHACHPAVGTVEACGTAHGSGHVLAVVARFQYSLDEWRCTYFALLDPGRERSWSSQPPAPLTSGGDAPARSTPRRPRRTR